MHIYMQKNYTPENTADSKSGVYVFYVTIDKKAIHQNFAIARHTILVYIVLVYAIFIKRISKKLYTRENTKKHQARNLYTRAPSLLSTVSRSKKTPSVESGALSGKHPTADIWRAAWQGVKAGWDLAALVPQLWRTCAPMSAAAIGFDLLVGSWGASWTMCSRELKLASPRHLA